jgi:hypothetical protein
LAMKLHPLSLVVPAILLLFALYGMIRTHFPHISPRIISELTLS